MRDSSAMAFRARVLTALKFLGWGVLLGLAYGQAPLYTSNQNQYFLHGLAQIGQGSLAEDWLANTVDPTPVFTWLVAVSTRFLPDLIFYLYYFLLFGIYLFSLRRIADQIFNVERSENARWVYLALIFVSHSAGMHLLLGQGIGGDWQYLFDGGLAGQRLLGNVLQPSSFGVFLLLSVQQFLDGHPYRAVIAAAVAATVHPTYLLSAAVLTLTYVLLELRKKDGYLESVKIGGLALLLVVPILAYTTTSFYPSGADAQGILVHFRLPEHAVVSEWIGPASLATLALIGLALLLTRNTKLFPILLVSILAALALSALQIITQSDTLALLFPWRLSTYLVPLSASALVAWFAIWEAENARERFARLTRPVSVALIALSVLSGVVWMAVQSQQQRDARERLVFDFVRTEARVGQLYAVPDKMQDFRLATRAPILADFKSIPYKRREVIQWHDRVRLLQWFYRDKIDCGLMGEFIEEYGVTHMVLGPEQLGQTCSEMNELYNDGSYAVFRLDG